MFKKYILFDMDGVLLDSNEIHYSAYLHAFKKFNINIDFEYEKFAGKSTKDTVNQILRQYSLNNYLESEIVVEKQAYMLDIFSKLKSPPLFPGVKDGIEYLKTKYELALCTSASMNTVNFFFKDGIDIRWFKHVLTSSDVKHSKPSPDIYLQAIKKFSADPLNTFIVEDSCSGLQAGLQTGANVLHIGKSGVPKCISEIDSNRIKTFKDFYELLLFFRSIN
jgi:beta-phosphoglucomutase